MAAQTTPTSSTPPTSQTGSTPQTPPPAATTRGGKIVPLLRSRVGGLIAVAGLALALLSLYLPWLSTATGGGITALDLTEVLDLRAMAPLNFLGLLVLLVLVAVTVFTRLGFFAAANAVLATLVLIAHLIFVWVLFNSTDTADPMLAGLPDGTSVTYGPFVAAVGFILVIAGSVLAAKSAEYLLPDRAEARMFKDPQGS
ncbi:hypothetical protein H483_0110875 [Dietzia sp. UCD-THP]|uniref:hypothetical protein n=1 Tax=Dietzia sp. UCD-THP TaxID=1292020 RepID=UPI000372B191|nr:hypothetical protein [Dietzia sp. UCD-THP]EYT62367.1 hypothetical protein H483_0110875 [Dietzia sp. UCD-THP]